jgi:hypothetical protein
MRGRESGEVTIRKGLCCLETLLDVFLNFLRVYSLRQRTRGRDRRTLQRGTLTRATLVDQHQVSSIQQSAKASFE